MIYLGRKSSTTDYDKIIKELLNTSMAKFNWYEIAVKYNLTKSKLYYLKRKYNKAVEQTKMNRKVVSTDGFNPNEITQTTVMCVCRWHFEYDSIKDIGEYLNRRENQILNILQRAFKSNEYLLYNLDHRIISEDVIREDCNRLKQISKTIVNSRDVMEEFDFMSCLNCSKRVLGCHSTCEEHQEYKAALKEQHDAKTQDKMYTDYKRQRIEKTRRKHGNNSHINRHGIEY